MGSEPCYPSHHAGTGSSLNFYLVDKYLISYSLVNSYVVMRHLLNTLLDLKTFQSGYDYKIPNTSFQFLAYFQGRALIYDTCKIIAYKYKHSW